MDTWNFLDFIVIWIIGGTAILYGSAYVAKTLTQCFNKRKKQKKQ